MIFEQAGNIYAIVLTVVGLIFCMSRYFAKPHRAWVYAIVFLLGNLLSNYYWGAYVLLMGDYPDVSSFMAYLGWNISYIPLVLLLLHLRSGIEKKFFSPLCLLPIPLNVWQFTLYIQYGGILNNIWSGAFCTAIACLSLNSILFWLKNRKNGAKKPYTAFSLFVFTVLEYIMWTSSCFDWPNEWLHPYNYASILFYTISLALPWAIGKDIHADREKSSVSARDYAQPVSHTGYAIWTAIFCVGGFLLVAWMKSILDAGAQAASEGNPYASLADILFCISLVVVLFTLAILLVNISPRVRNVWNELSRSLFEGERHSRSLKIISAGAILIAAVSVVTGIMNLKNGYMNEAESAVSGVVAGIVVFYLSAIRKNRKLTVIITVLYFMAVYTYDAFTSTNGFAILWTLILPLAVGYLGSVKWGLVFSLYFECLYLLLFNTPLARLVEGHYSQVIMNRFPILYFVNMLVTSFIMVQYHLNTLHQMDNAKQLTGALEAAKQANRAKSDFLADMSHEIRTPINAVLGMNEMILRESTQARDSAAADHSGLRTAFQEITSYAGNIENAGKNLLAIINDVLDFSKIEAGKMELVEGEYRLSTVLNDVSNMIFFRVKDKGLDFLADVDETIPDCLFGDAVRVRQIILNLLNNAVKYTNEGSIRLSVRMETEEPVEPGRNLTLIVAVQDTGIGIRQEDLGKIFEKFQRVDLKQNSTVEGTGLGLAIIHKLLGKMGGSIRVESRYGAGSTFTASIPQTTVSAEPLGDYQMKPEASLRETKACEASFQAPDARILLVDDTRMNLMVAAGLLQNTGMMIDTAGSGADAIKMARANRYDVILMDQRMPEMDGTEAMRRIRETENGLNRETPVICLTADAVIGARERYLAEGFTDYLTKPADSRALEKMLKKYLPAEKVMAGDRKEPGTAGTDAGAQTDADLYPPLREAGVDPAIGLGYCGHDESLYRLLLQEYAQAAEKRLPEMRDYLKRQDWKQYEIQAHAVKSTSKTIGASELSVLAAGLERALHEENAESIPAQHEQVLEAYTRVVAAIREALPETGGSTAAEGEDILEFLPET